MKNMAALPLVFLATMVPLIAAEVPDKTLTGTWEKPPWTNGLPTARSTTWLTLTFSTNEMVKWEWERGGNKETCSGVVAKIEKASATEQDKQGHQTIRIFPDRSDLTEVVMESVRVGADSRFPATWSVLRFKCGEEDVVLMRREDILRVQKELGSIDSWIQREQEIGRFRD